jgi:hypothetical protein
MRSICGQGIEVIEVDEDAAAAKVKDESFGASSVSQFNGFQFDSALSSSATPVSGVCELKKAPDPPSLEAGGSRT